MMQQSGLQSMNPSYNYAVPCASGERSRFLLPGRPAGLGPIAFLTGGTYVPDFGGVVVLGSDEGRSFAFAAISGASIARKRRLFSSTAFCGDWK